MRRRDTLAILALAWPPSTPAADPDSEAAVRQATTAYVQAWNRHDVKAWSEFLTADTWYAETEDFYERFKGREKAVGWFAFSVQNSDLHGTSHA